MSGHRKLAGITLAAFLVVGASGCGGDGGDKLADKLAEKAAEEAGGGNVDINSEDGKVTFEDDNGNSFEMGSAELPDGWPVDLAPPDSVTIVSASTNTLNGQKSQNVTGVTDGTVAELASALKDQVTNAGYEVTNENQFSGTDGDFATMTASDGATNLIVTISQGDLEGDDSKVTISFSLREEE